MTRPLPARGSTFPHFNPKPRQHFHQFQHQGSFMADTPLASAACSACHRLKRKCTRELPTCALCKRVGRACKYDGSASPVTPTSLSRSSGHGRHGSGVNHADGMSWSRQTSGRSTPQTSRLPRLQLDFNSASGLNSVRSLDAAARFPAAWFLDSVVCRGSKINLPYTPNWDDLVQEPGSVGREEAWEVAERYFGGTQRWMPIGL